MLRKFIRKLTSLTIQPFVRIYLSRDRSYHFGETRIIVKKNVFHPGFFFSTKFLLSSLTDHDLKEKTLLEPGAGAGLISIEAARRGAIVTASDISAASVENLYLNAALNRVSLKIIRSDLFDEIPAQHFDFIVINPPYYKKDPATEPEFAWYAGSQLEYFSKLFGQIKNFMSRETIALMVLSEDCDLISIQKMAEANGLSMKLEKRKIFLWEENFVFQIMQPDENQ